MNQTMFTSLNIHDFVLSQKLSFSISAPEGVKKSHSAKHKQGW